AASQGIGYVIWTAYKTFQIARMFVGLMTIACLGYLFSLALRALAQKLTPWRGPHDPRLPGLGRRGWTFPRPSPAQDRGPAPVQGLPPGGPAGDGPGGCLPGQPRRGVLRAPRAQRLRQVHPPADLSRLGGAQRGHGGDPPEGAPGAVE